MTGLFLATTTQRAVKDVDFVDKFSSELLKLMGFSQSYGPFVEWGLRIFLALIIFIFFIIQARQQRIRRLVDKIDDAIGFVTLSNADRAFFSFVIWVAIWFVGLVLILYALKLTGLLATIGISAGALAAIAAMANRELLGNLFAGLALQGRRQVAPGDSVQVMGVSGKMVYIGLTASVIEDFAGVKHYIPNSKLINERMVNYSKAEFRRAEIKFWFDPKHSKFEDVEKVLQQVISEAPGKADGKESFAVYGDLSDRGQEVKLLVYFQPDNWFKNASKTREILCKKLLENGIALGIPHYVCLEDSAGEKKNL